MHKNLIILLCLTILSTGLYAQIDSLELMHRQKNQQLLKLRYECSEMKYVSVDSLETGINPPQINKELFYYGVLGGSTLSLGILYYYFQTTWWQGHSTKFRFVDDIEYALYMDKLGHFWDGQILTHGLSAALESCDFTIEKSYLYGAIGSIAYLTLIEVTDGFGEDFGFSKYDELANILGSGYSVAQYYFPYLKNFNFKWSYYPSADLQKSKDGNFADDYNGQTQYLSIRIYEMLPDSYKKYWPNFLSVAFGYAIRNWNGYGQADKVFSICFDYDLEKIPLYGKTWQFIKNTLNYIHFPAPGIKIINNNVYFTICY